MLSTTRSPSVEPLPGLALTLLAALLAAGCSSPLVRTIDTTLGREARIYLVAGPGRAEELMRDEQGRVTLVLPGPSPVPYEQRFRLVEPRKPPLVADVEVYIDPPSRIEDELHFRSNANKVIFKTTQETTVGTYGGQVLRVYQEPLAELRDPLGGPWFLPARGQGVVLTAEGRGETARVGDEVRSFTPHPSGRGTLPLVFALEPGPVGVSVRLPGYQSYRRQLEVAPGRYTLLTVRLAEERAP